MTDKITLSRELAQLALNAVEYLALRGDDIGISNVPVAEELRTALAERVPPAGGDVISDLISVMRNAVRDDANNGGHEFFEKARSAEDELRAHVTRLQAEVERLKQTAPAEGLRSALTECIKQRDQYQSDLTKALELLKEADNFMYIMTGHDSHARLVHQYGKEWWTPVNELRGKICTALSNQSAPADKGEPPNYKPGLYAVRHIDNWDGERDVVLAFAQLDAEGNWTEKETGEALLTYRGDKILNAWPLDFQAPAEQPAPVAVDEGVEFEKWWMSAEILRKGKLQVAQEAWQARAELARLNPIKQ